VARVDAEARQADARERDLGVALRVALLAALAPRFEQAELLQLLRVGAG